MTREIVRRGRRLVLTPFAGSFEQTQRLYDIISYGMIRKTILQEVQEYILVDCRDFVSTGMMFVTTSVQQSARASSAPSGPRGWYSSWTDVAPCP